MTATPTEDPGSAPPPPGLRERKKLETWRALRAAALRLITERGFDAVTVEDIAAEAQVAKRTFFNYFDSKEAVVFDPDPEEPQRWAELAAARPAGEDTWDGLREFFLAYLGSHGTKLGISKRLIAASPSLALLSRSTSERLHAFVTAWVVERTAAEGITHFDALVVTGAAHAVVNTAFNAWDPETGIAALQDLLRQGFDTLTTRPSPTGRRKDPAS